MSMRTERSARGGRGAGFTLIELLAVIIILSILAYALVSQLGSATKAVDVQVTKVTMTKLGGAIAEISDESGDFPRSKFSNEQGLPPNNTNLGSECLYLALCAEGAPGADFEEHLGNTDEDQTAKRMPGFQVATLFEFKDQWDNPIAYFHHSDYGREDTYVTIDEQGQRQESLVRALKSAKTGRYYEATSYQMFSAGPDCVFGSEDDVTSFSKK